MKRQRTEDLLSPEKSNRTIRILPGKTRNSILCMVLGCFLAVAAFGCIVYCGSIAAIQSGSRFYLVWGAAALICTLLAVIFLKPRLLQKIPKWVKRTFIALMMAGFLIVGGLFLMIGNAVSYHAEPGAEYLIVLGAQWRNSGPSAVLRYRLEAAIDYLEQNPETKVIVSGGRGDNEPISEAEGMAGYLCDAGIASERIILENHSTSTYENLEFSKEFCDITKDRILIITNDFHVYRAVKLAETMGYKDVSGLAALSNKWLLPHNTLRECAALLKEVLTGNIKLNK